VAAGFGFRRLGAADPGEVGDPVDHADHLVGHPAQDIVRRGAVARAFQILKSAFGVVRKCDAAAGEYGNAAGMGHLFDEQNLGSGVMRRNGRDPSRRAVTDDDDIHFFVPVLLSVHGAHQLFLLENTNDLFKRFKSSTARSGLCRS
jgi:hypothetical protein